MNSSQNSINIKFNLVGDIKLSPTNNSETMSTVIVTGGSGYIGSAICYYLIKSGYKVINLDKCRPNESKFITDKNYEWIECDLVDSNLPLIPKLKKSINGTRVMSIIHMAAYKDLTESYRLALDYYHNNLVSTLNVLELANIFRAESFLFSSSAAVYDDSCEGCIKEIMPGKVTAPSPYGNTKLIAERIIEEVCTNYGINSMSLRYQNPIGAIQDCTIDNSDSMFGNIYNSIKNNSTFTIFGNDYNTVDGSCIRDYIDIKDIALIHVKLAQKMSNTLQIYHRTVNVGRGKPLTCIQVCKIVSELYPNFKFKFGPRRSGDAPGSYADISHFELLIPDFNFTPIEDTIKRIIETAQS